MVTLLKSKNMLKTIKNLQFLFRPNFWLMNEPFSKEWDDKLNQLMDKFEPVLGRPSSLDGVIHTVEFGGHCVWISNYPYAYGKPYSTSMIFNGVRPSRLTILRLHKMVTPLKMEFYKQNSPVKKYMDEVNETLNNNPN